MGTIITGCPDAPILVNDDCSIIIGWLLLGRVSPPMTKFLVGATSILFVGLDGVRAWLNGKLIVSSNASRGAAPGQEKVAVDLNAGWNELLMKITQGGDGWGLYADFLTPEGQPLPDLTYAPRKP